VLNSFFCATSCSMVCCRGRESQPESVLRWRFHVSQIPAHRRDPLAAGRSRLSPSVHRAACRRSATSRSRSSRRSRTRVDGRVRAGIRAEAVPRHHRQPFDGGVVRIAGRASYQGHRARQRDGDLSRRHPPAEPGDLSTGTGSTPGTINAEPYYPPLADFQPGHLRSQRGDTPRSPSITRNVGDDLRDGG
jgi:hypothetical protein